MIGTLQVSGSGHASLGERCCSVGTPVQHCNWPLAYIRGTIRFLIFCLQFATLQHCRQINCVHLAYSKLCYRRS